ncbi:MAG TPA: YraN family protein [Caulobacteraceae bacterium]|nr:YraN family protein [Caulobacteraceae bacterium]
MSEARRLRGSAARVSGRRGELLAAFWLMAKGYRILAFRLRLRQGEIDLLAMRRGVLVAVEVKARASLEAALEAVTPMQRQRIRRALRAFVARRPRYAAAELRLDLLALAPGRFPRHIRDAWSEDDDS